MIDPYSKYQRFPYPQTLIHFNLPFFYLYQLLCLPSSVLVANVFLLIVLCSVSINVRLDAFALSLRVPLLPLPEPERPLLVLPLIKVIDHKGSTEPIVEQEDIPDFEVISPVASITSDDPMEIEEVDEVVNDDVAEEPAVTEVTEEGDLSKCDLQEIIVIRKFLHVRFCS